MKNINSILCVHQGYELYGSDRSFFQCVMALSEKWPHARIDIVLPKNGPLSNQLRSAGLKVTTDDLWVARKANLRELLFFGMPRLIKRICVCRKQIKKYDLVYINTIVVVDFILAAMKADTILHVREMPSGEIEKFILRFLLHIYRGSVIFNSEATATIFKKLNSKRSKIVWNGVPDCKNIINDFNTVNHKMHLLFVGRLNSWKGQDLLVEAITKLPNKIRKNIKIRIVGDAFSGQEHYKIELIRKVEDSGLLGQVEIVGFVEKTEPEYRWSDVVVVPSRRPEPFGRVAVEAMAMGRVVVAANHGGLKEIIQPGITGLLFNPNDSDSLASCLVALYGDMSLLKSMGHKARERYLKWFSEEKFRVRFISAVEELLALK